MGRDREGGEGGGVVVKMMPTLMLYYGNMTCVIGKGREAADTDAASDATDAQCCYCRYALN